jgi:hypothetical protein
MFVMPKFTAFSPSSTTFKKNSRELTDEQSTSSGVSGVMMAKIIEPLQMS